MTELEKRITSVIDSLKPKGNTGKAIRGIKQTIYSSSHIVDSINNFGDNLQHTLSKEGGIPGAVGGWIAGKTTKFMGSVTGGIVVGALKTVAGIIPDSSDIKLPESDRKVAHSVDTCPIPVDKYELYYMLQYISSALNSQSSPFGQQTKASLKSLHARVYSAFLQVAKDDCNLLALSKDFMPKKRFGILTLPANRK